MSQSEFVWTFPCFILATQFNRNPETDTVLIDEDFRFIAPALHAGEMQVAIFTDAALAESFAARSGHPDLEPVEFSTPSALKEFLLIAVRNFRHAAIDPSRKLRTRLFLIDEILAQIDGWIDQHEDFEQQN